MTNIVSPENSHVNWYPPGTTGPDNTILDTGWYFRNEYYKLTGPFSTEKLAISSYDNYMAKFQKTNEEPRKLVKPVRHRRDIS